MVESTFVRKVNLEQFPFVSNLSKFIFTTFSNGTWGPLSPGGGGGGGGVVLKG